MKENPRSAPAASIPVGRTLAASAICAAILSFELIRRATPSWWFLIALWLLSMALAGMAAAGSSGGRPRRARAERRTQTLLMLVGIFVAAFLVRWIRLDDLPYAMGGDEGSQAISAVAVLEGKITNPFGTGWYSVPTLFFFVQAASIAVFGDSIGGVRTVSAVVGAATVLLTYLLVRRLSDRWTALMAALLLAVHHYHVHFSRLASHQVYDGFFVVLLLLLLDRSLAGDRPLEWLLCGFVLGISQYFHFGARLLPLVWIAAVGHALVRRALGPAGARFEWLRRRGAGLMGWGALGAALAYLPLAIHYLRHPVEWNSRVRQVSVFASGWLTREHRATGISEGLLLLRQFQKAALLPFTTFPDGWYRGPGVPFAGWPIVPFLALGLLLVTLRFWRSRFFPVAVTYWAAVVGLSLTDGPAQTQRATIISPLLPIFTAFGVSAFVRLGLRLGSAVGRLTLATAVAGVAIMLVWNVRFYFRSPEDIARYADRNTLAATDLGRYLRAEAPRHRVYFAGMPHMRYDGFQCLRFIARRARASDVDDPWTEATLPAALPGPTVFAFLSWRADDFPVVRRRFPGGRVRRYLWVDGSLLLIIYDVRPGGFTPGPGRGGEGLSWLFRRPAARPCRGCSAPSG